MTVTLELKADEARVLQEIARTAGTTVEAVLHALIAQVSPSRSAESKSAEAENAEAPTENAEAVAERRRQQEEVEANVRRWHEERASL